MRWTRLLIKIWTVASRTNSIARFKQLSITSSRRRVVVAKSQDVKIPESSIRIILVDDDPMACELISRHLGKESYNVEVYHNAEDGLAAFKEAPAGIVITDLHLPGMNGIELLSEIKKLQTHTEVIIISGDADKEAAISALHQGAFDMFEKPLDLKKISATIHRTAKYQEALRKCESLDAQVRRITDMEGERWSVEGFIGKSKAVQGVIKQVRQLQKNDRISVLIRGESGTGKELVAHAIHYGSTRSSNPIVPINCSAVPDDLAESMFFGHIKGSFTGAAADKKGCFEAADGGTLFLDEIGDMLPAIQIKLLRVLEDGLVMPVGATGGRKVDVRVIAATNADLDAKVKQGAFREDLYYRLARFTIDIPPLRDRKNDIPLLTEHFVDRISSDMAIQRPRVSSGFKDALVNRDFKGNVRELRNIIERAIIICAGDELRPEHILDTGLHKSAASAVDTGEIPENLKEAEAWLIKRAIERCNGNISEAARRLGITRAKIYRYK